MKTTQFLLILGVFFVLNLQAQQTEEETSVPVPSKNAIGVQVGLLGFGGDYARVINNQFSGRLQINYFSFAMDNKKYNISAQDILVDASVKFFNFDVLIDYYPFKERAFKLVAGLAIFINQDISATISLSENMDINDIPFTPDQIGMVGLTNTWARLAPYAAIAVGRAVPKKRVGFGFELGGYYVGKPVPTIIATGMLSETKDEEQQLASDMSEYRWLPMLKLRLAIKLNK